MAVSLGYKNVYRDPHGFPLWNDKGLPIEAASGISVEIETEPTGFTGPLHGFAMILTLLGIFAGGMALNLTPCVYPLIPITVSYFGGRSNNRNELIAHGLCYIGGLALTNSIIGVIASLTGGLMGSLLQNPLVLIMVALVLTLFAASLFGFWEIRVPFSLMQFATRSHTGFIGSFFMGVMLGVVAAPCIGPFVLGLLTWVASMGSPWLGFIIFFTLSLGLGLPLFFLALFSGNITKLPRSGEWMIWVRKLMGWVLLGMAVYFLRPVLPKNIEILFMAATALAAGLHLAFFDKTTAGFKAFAWIKSLTGMAALGFVFLIIGTWFVQGPGVNWQPYSTELMAQAKEMKRGVIMDFSADWCAPCREMEEITFHDRSVVENANQDFIMVKVDLTRNEDPVNDVLVKNFGVRGVPTIVFLDEKGNELKDLRVVDFEGPELFKERMNKAKQSRWVR